MLFDEIVQNRWFRPKGAATLSIQLPLEEPGIIIRYHKNTIKHMYDVDTVYLHEWMVEIYGVHMSK